MILIGCFLFLGCTGLETRLPDIEEEISSEEPPIKNEVLRFADPEKELTALCKGSSLPNEWVTFVIGIKMDKDFDPNNNRFIGEIQFCFNGEQQTLSNSVFQDYQVVLSADSKTAYNKTNDGKEVYPKRGAYNENACIIELILI